MMSFLQRVSIRQILLCSLLIQECTCFVRNVQTSFVSKQKLTDGTEDFSFVLQSSADNDDSSANRHDNDPFLQQLRERLDQMNEKEQNRVSRLREARCASSVAVVLPDWVRRLDVGTYPLAACGSASGEIYVANLESGAILASSEKYNALQEKEKLQYETDDSMTIDDEILDTSARTLRLLFGQNDGGGTISIAMHGTLIAEGSRYGGVRIWRYNPESSNLICQGSMLNFNDCIATSLKIDENYLWIGTDDGRVEAYSLESESKIFKDGNDSIQLDILPLVLQSNPQFSWNLQSTVLSLSLSSETGCVVATTQSGAVHLMCPDDYDPDIENIAPSFMPPFDFSDRRFSLRYAHCTSIVATKNTIDGTSSYSIACGGNDGSIYLQKMRMISSDEIDTERPFQGQSIRQFLPSHFGPVKCLASPAPGLLISGGLDGSLRVWDIRDRIRNLYQFLGYKVWLGSLWTDGEKIVTDGADNTIIMHDFSSKAQENKRPPNNSNSDDSHPESKNDK